MELFIGNIPYAVGDNQIRKTLDPHVRSSGAHVFYLQTFRSKGARMGTMTLPTLDSGNKFLEAYGQKTRNGKPRVPIKMLERVLSFQGSKKPFDRFRVKTLLLEEEALLRKAAMPPKQKSIDKKMNKSFEIKSISCGIWSTQPQDSTPVYTPYYTLQTSGAMRFGGQVAQIELKKDILEDDDFLSQLSGYKHLIIISYTQHVNSIIASEHPVPQVIFTLKWAPKFYREEFSHFLESPGSPQKERERVSNINEEHGCFAPFSSVYCVTLADSKDAELVKRLGKHAGIPPIYHRYVITRGLKIPFEKSFFELARQLQSSFSFPVAFQLHAIFANGFLPPLAILQILPKISELAARLSDANVADILYAFINRLPEADPLQSPGALSYDSLLSILQSCEKDVLRSIPYRSLLADRQAHMSWIRHVQITPVGCYFDGPKLEAQNRVLRKYPDHHDYFIRVTFCDEDGEQLVYEPRVNQRAVYYGQFLQYLSSGGKFVVAGRGFSFLGFSSSSLRSQTCWFMAPFEFQGEQLDAAKVIAKLGDFSGITCPGRCAARIGQAFSDTVSSINVSVNAERDIEDIKRNGRVFSDGVGKISQKMVDRIWAETNIRDHVKPTVFQIRFAGAKGVVALDERLAGDQLCLRPSMVKFRGSNDRNIEICSWANPLLMFLNRPLIKALEDLGVSDETFLNLQTDAVDMLHRSTRSAAHASYFLKRRRIAPASLRLPWMVEALSTIGLPFRDDEFLEQAFELALLTALREIKHRSRIPVPGGLTLMGVVDETGLLEAGQIYCPIETDEEGRWMISGTVMITRSPVHHPGDIQMAEAISKIPLGSPLRALRNCVVFSSKGERDLPSMLSGGDLDGDLYNVIYDPRFYLKETYEPAEYPRTEPIDLGRPVTSDDIVQFFLDFMQNNILGLISNRHLLLADQHEKGVFHHDCLKLAEMASTAVDFPKTGIKVDKSQIPRGSRVRPDFMAPGPRILVEKEKVLSEFTEQVEDEDDDNSGAPRYYKSDKILGKLYRDIDEQAFIEEVQEEIGCNGLRKRVNVLQGLWAYMDIEISKFVRLGALSDKCRWSDYGESANELKYSYEQHIIELMSAYSETPWKSSLKEVEVFIGVIVGREKQNKRQRELSCEMRDEYDRLVSSIIDGIKRHDTREEMLAIAMACLLISLPGANGRQPLNSFAWIAASILLIEVDKLQRDEEKRSKAG